MLKGKKKTFFDLDVFVCFILPSFGEKVESWHKSYCRRVKFSNMNKSILSRQRFQLRDMRPSRTRFQMASRHHILTKNLHGCWPRDWKRAIKTCAQVHMAEVATLPHMNGLILLIEHLNKQKKQCPWPQTNISCWHAKELQAYESCHTFVSYRCTHFTLQRMYSLPSLNTLLHDTIECSYVT